MCKGATVKELVHVSGVPVVSQVVLDCTDARALAEFYRELLGLTYRPGDAPPPDGSPEVEDRDWLCLRVRDGQPLLAFQQVDRLVRATWPDDSVPQQLHLDMTVDSTDELRVQHERVLALGGTMLLDRFDDPEEPLRVYADPAGHPFCIFVVDEEATAARERELRAADDEAHARARADAEAGEEHPG